MRGAAPHIEAFTRKLLNVYSTSQMSGQNYWLSIHSVSVTFGISGQDQSLPGEVGHGVVVDVGDVDGVMDAGVVKLDVDGVLRLVVDALDNPDRVPDHEA